MMMPVVLAAMTLAVVAGLAGTKPVEAKVFAAANHPVASAVMKLLSKSDAEKAALKSMVVHGMMAVGVV